MNKYAKLGMYHHYQILQELERMGFETITVSGQPATPERAKTEGGITSSAGAAEFSQAGKNLQARNIDSDYDVCFFSEDEKKQNRDWMRKNGFQATTGEDVLEKQELDVWPDESSAKRR